jgi:lipid II:glycine glycyltransferase (peptidoglycan interpeptide bridge formation enzyme)
MEELGWAVEKVGPKNKEQYAFVRKIPVFGKILKAPRLVTPIPFEQLDALAADEKLAFAKIEPAASSKDKNLTRDLLAHGFKKDKWALHPTKTILLDLRPSENEMISSMEKDTRYSIRAAQRRGVRVVKTKSLERFLAIYRQTAQRQKFWIAEKEMGLLWQIFSKESKAFILIAEWNKTDLAGCLILHHERKAYYYHAASINRLRELYAPYLLVWEAMTKCKEMRLRELDLEGIYDPRVPATKKWQGFTHFKKGFRGDELELAGSFVKNYQPLASLFFKFSNLV